MYDVFISSTLKSNWNLRFNKRICILLEYIKLKCFLPQRDVEAGNPVLIFDQNINAINSSKVILSVAINETPSFGVEARSHIVRKKRLFSFRLLLIKCPQCLKVCMSKESKLMI